MPAVAKIAGHGTSLGAYLRRVVLCSLLAREVGYQEGNGVRRGKEKETQGHWERMEARPSADGILG